MGIVYCRYDDSGYSGLLLYYSIKWTVVIVIVDKVDCCFDDSGYSGLLQY